MTLTPSQKILVIGDKGQLGSQFVSSCADVSNVFLGSTFSLDVTKHDELNNLLNSVEAEVVVNCAAYTAVDNAEEFPEKAFVVNGESVRVLAEWCSVNDSHLIHISTDYVFDGKKELYEPYIEQDKVEPLSVYGKSKLLGEEAIIQQDDLRYTILRTAWLYGATGKNFLKTMLRLVLSNPAGEYKVIADQYGSPTSADILAKQIQAVISGQAYGLFHATSHGYCTWYEFACEFLALMGMEHNLQPCKTEEYPTAAVRPKNSILQNMALQEAGLDVFVDWRDDLALFVDSYGAAIKAEFEQAISGSAIR